MDRFSPSISVVSGSYLGKNESINVLSVEVRAHDNRSKDVALIQSTFSATLSAIRQSFLLELSVMTTTTTTASTMMNTESRQFLTADAIRRN